MYKNKYENMKINKVEYDDFFKTGLNMYLSKIDNSGNLINKKIRYNLLKADYNFNYYYDPEQEYRMRSIFNDEFTYYGYNLTFEEAKSLINKKGFNVYEYENICTLLPIKDFIPIKKEDIGHSCEFYIYRIVDDGSKYTILGSDNNGYYRKINLKYTFYDNISLSNIVNEEVKEKKMNRINHNLDINMDKLKKITFKNTKAFHYDVNIKSELIVNSFNKDGLILPWLDFKKI